MFASMRFGDLELPIWNCCFQIGSLSMQSPAVRLPPHSDGSFHWKVFKSVVWFVNSKIWACRSLQIPNDDMPKSSSSGSRVLVADYWFFSISLQSLLLQCWPRTKFFSLFLAGQTLSSFQRIRPSRGKRLLLRVLRVKFSKVRLDRTERFIIWKFSLGICDRPDDALSLLTQITQIKPLANRLQSYLTHESIAIEHHKRPPLAFAHYDFASLRFLNQEIVASILWRVFYF